MMLERLVYVAQDVPQLANAIFAVTQWTANVASRKDVEQYMLEMDVGEGKNGVCHPLRTIIRRVLLHQPQNDVQLDPSTLTAGCANLITTVLLSPACNLKTGCDNDELGDAHFSALKKVLEELLGRGRALVLQMSSDIDGATGSTPDQVAENVSNCILELLQRASEEKRGLEMRSRAGRTHGDARRYARVTTGNQAEEVVRRLEVEISALASKLSRRQRDGRTSDDILPKEKIPRGAVSDLLAKRDWMKEIAEKFGAVLEISLGQNHALNNETEVQANGGMGEEESHLLLFQSPEAKQELVQEIMGPSLCTSIASSIDEVQSLESEIGRVHAETSREHSVLSTRQKSLSSKRKEVIQRMNQLRKELADLEVQDKELAKDETAVLTELAQLEVSSEREIQGLEEKVHSKIKHVAADQAVRQTVDKIEELEGAWVRSLSSSVATSAVATSPAPILPRSKIAITSLVPLKLEQYLHFAHSYFQTEAQSIEFLRKRVSSMEVEILGLEGELQSCLGKSICVGPMSIDLRTLKLRVIEDKKVIDALMENTKEMRLDLIRRIEAYCSSMMKGEPRADKIAVVDMETLRASHVMSLEGISMELTGIDSHVDADGRMNGIFSNIYLARNAPSKSNSMRKHLEVTEASEVAPRTGPANGKPPAPQLMGKCGWANQANTARRKETRSLLDIQKEEMLRRKAKSIRQDGIGR